MYLTDLKYVFYFIISTITHHIPDRYEILRLDKSKHDRCCLVDALSINRYVLCNIMYILSVSQYYFRKSSMQLYLQTLLMQLLYQ